LKTIRTLPGTKGGAREKRRERGFTLDLSRRSACAFRQSPTASILAWIAGSGVNRAGAAILARSLQTLFDDSVKASRI